MLSCRDAGRSVLVIALCGFSAAITPAWGQVTNTTHGPQDIYIEASEGTVEILTDHGTRWIALTPQDLKPGDLVRTRPNSRVTIRWTELSVLRLGERTYAEIRAPHKPGALPGLRLIQGIISFFHRNQPGLIEALTSGGMAGVKGTEFALRVETVNGVEQTTLSVIDGRVTFSNALGAPLIVTNLQEATASPVQAPRYTAGFIANNRLQWCFYYPGILDLRDLPLTPAEETILAASLRAYRQGDLLAALRLYPDGRTPGSDAERLYHAALFLSVGQVPQTETGLAVLPPGPATDRVQRVATALRVLIAAVKRQPNPSTLNPQLSTELLAASYYEQSLAVREKSLESALSLARQAATISPDFGFAWERVAELEFSFGRTERAEEAFEKSFALSPRNAEAMALEGFLLAAQNKARQAIDWFNYAIAADSSFGNAWLGRGLCRIRGGDLEGGREDLLVAAALEPQRALLRSYLGKAYGEEGDYRRAVKESDRAKYLDPKDPTSWLYSALFNEQHNRINEAIRDLEHSQELNENRSVYRSELLLDQDRAVRSANLARIYGEAGLDDVALREASRAEAADYGNFSAHLFLADSYLQLLSANRFDLRYQTPAFSEYLIASLLGPADGRLLAQSVSQQEYTRLFERDTLGLSTSTEYLSRGAWNQYAAQYGTSGNSSYALENNYISDRGEAPNANLNYWDVSLKFKQMLSPNDGLYLEVFGFDKTAGDLSQKYNPELAIRNLEVKEKREPSAAAGLDHKWSETQSTLLLAGHFNDSLQVTNPHSVVLLEKTVSGLPYGFLPVDLSQEYRHRLNIDSVEIQHLILTRKLQTIAGVRAQVGTEQLSNLQTINPGNSIGYENFFGNPGEIINQSLRAHSFSVTPYAYEYWQISPSLLVIGGISYDYQSVPRNTRFAPLEQGNEVQRGLSPKAGMIWMPFDRIALRGAYSRSLSGFDLDQSIRLEPTQVAGFVQAYGNLFPDSLVGGISGARLETADVSADYRFNSGTYLAVAAEILRSKADSDFGGFQRDFYTSEGPPVQFDRRLRFQERALDLSAHQLVGDCISLGARYRLSDSWLLQKYPGVDPSFGNTSTTFRGTLQTVGLEAMVQLPSGLFAGLEAVWWSQLLRADLAATPGDRFWQENVSVGYRFSGRRAQITTGVLNLSGRSYQLYPINLYPDLPRSRTFFISVQLNF